MCLYLYICIVDWDMDNDKICCPICSKEFSSVIIENHVSKCLFLNESTSKESSSSFKDGSPARKYMKLSNTKVKKDDVGLVKNTTKMVSSVINVDSQSPTTSINNNVLIFFPFIKKKEEY